MSTLLTSLEIDLQWLGAIAGLGTLAYAIYRILRAQAMPSGYQSGAAQRVLRTRYLIIASLLFCLLGYFLWKPLPIQLLWQLRLLLSLVGAVVFFAGLGLYLWGMAALGESFNASSGFGVRLQRAHQLVTAGPYRLVRHPMYLGVILAGWGGLLLYRTWMMLLFAIIMFGLIVRANREEQALAEVYGRQWQHYQRTVPGWLPRVGGKGK